MPVYHEFEFFLVQYVPDIIKGTPVSVGVVLRDPTGMYSDVKITRDLRAVKCLDWDADEHFFYELEEELRRVLRSSVELDQVFLYQKLPDWASNGLQLTPMRGVLTDSPQKEMARLLGMYCETERRGRRALSGRQVIYNAIRSSFEEAGVWNWMRTKIPVAQYTSSGDPLKLDCGYGANGTVHLFHAVSLTTDVDSAKALAFSYPRIVDGIVRMESARTTLTAIVEDGLDHHEQSISYGLRVLTESSISVEPMAMLPSIAEGVRRDLRI